MRDLGRTSWPLDDEVVPENLSLMMVVAVPQAEQKRAVETTGSPHCEQYIANPSNS